MNVNGYNNDQLFFKLWRNIVINRVIFKFSRLYIKNNIVVLNNSDSFREYKEKEFITTLRLRHADHKCDFTVLKGDLPENGVLKEIDLSSTSIYNKLGAKITCDAIPNSVQTIHFNTVNDEIQLSELPSSVHTVINVKLKRPYIYNIIPETITSISFNPHTDRFDFSDIIFPNSIKELDCTQLSTSSPFPPSVTYLSMVYENGRYVTPSIIPKSVINLDMAVYGKLTKGSIPSSVKELTIKGSNKDMNLLENTLPNSITKLTISIDLDTKDGSPSIKPNTIPDSVKDLVIIFDDKYQKSLKGVFPDSITSLELFNRHLTTDDIKISELPKSIKYLKLNHIEINIPKHTSYWDYFSF